MGRPLELAIGAPGDFQVKLESASDSQAFSKIFLKMVFGSGTRLEKFPSRPYPIPNAFWSPDVYWEVTYYTGKLSYTLSPS